MLKKHMIVCLGRGDKLAVARVIILGTSCISFRQESTEVTLRLTSSKKCSCGGDKCCVCPYCSVHHLWQLAAARLEDLERAPPLRMVEKTHMITSCAEGRGAMLRDERGPDTSVRPPTGHFVRRSGAKIGQGGSYHSTRFN
eukprot:2347078-Amphidinium_carterae.1